MTLDPQKPEGNKNVLFGALAGIVALAVAVGAFVYVGKDKGEEAPAAQIAAVETPEAADQAVAPAAGEADNAETATAEQAPAGDIDGVVVRQGNPVVAKVDGHDITRVDVFNFIQLLPPQVQQLPAGQVYPMALEQVINTRLIQNKAEASNVEQTDEFKHELAMAKQQIARNVFVENVIDEKLSDAELKKQYNQLIGNMPTTEERKASHILVATKEAADDVLKRINEGANFNDIAKTESTDPTAAQNAGDLGWFTKDAMIPEFAQAAFAMKKGEISKTPVQTQFGWHVIKMDDVRTQPKPSFEQVKPALEMQARRETLEKMVNDWRDAANIEVFDINGDPVGEDQSAAPQNVAPAAAPTQAPATEQAPAVAE